MCKGMFRLFGLEASRTIGHLEQFGIVKIQPVGRAYQLFLNDQSYALNKIVEPILMAEEKTISELIEILAKHLTTKKIISVSVFGSVAKGEEKEDSHIDLLVISDDFDYAAEVIADASEDIALVFHTRILQSYLPGKSLSLKKRVI